MIYRALLMAQSKNIPKPLIHYDFSRYSNQEFIDNPDMLVKDLTGNGHDLKLYNFAFAGMSGFGGYEKNWDEWLDVYIGNNGHNYQENNVLHILEISGWANTITDVVSGETVKLKLRVSGLSEGITNNEVQNIKLYFNASAAGSTLYIREDGDYNVILTAPEDATKFYILAKSTETLTGWTPLTTPITIEQLPTYPGGLVSDGVDDYGKCVKGFSLPDDYTVVALRKILNEKGIDSSFAAKSSRAGRGAFLLENGNGAVYSYGEYNGNLGEYPPLFIYQTKTSYCGKTITPGTSTDTENDILCLFRKRITESSAYYKCVLYDFRIYDHSLTDEELQLVKDDMMRNYEKNAKPLEGITYVADWDGKGRSNDEDADVRDKWIDKATGKVIDLHNFAFAGMSGWNGYSEDFNSITVPAPSDITDHIILHTVTSVNNVWIWSRYSATSIYNTIASMRIRITGVSTLSATLRYYYIPDENPATRYFIDINSDGIYTLPSSVKYTGEGSHNVGLYLINLTEASIGKTVKVEQLPLYPGALVCDGVDDYGVTQEAINEEVGTALVMLKVANNTKSGSYFVNCGKNENANRLYCWLPSGGIPKMGLPSRDITLPMGVLTRTPASPSEVLYIASYTGGSPSKIALYCLILIREQLNEEQIEYLKWKVEKEYREWCKKNGYDYALNQLTE